MSDDLPVPNQFDHRGIGDDLLTIPRMLHVLQVIQDQMLQQRERHDTVSFQLATEPPANWTPGQVAEMKGWVETTAHLMTGLGIVAESLRESIQHHLGDGEP